jgi:ribosome biogenesis GTPase
MSQFVCRYKMRDMGVQQAEPRFEPKKHRRKSHKIISQSILDELVRKSHKIINQSILDELEEDDDDLEVEK